MRTIVRFSINSLNSIGRKSALEAIANQIAHRRLYHKPYASANRISEYIIAEILNNHKRASLRLVRVLMNISG